jgi:tetratricopeptide (TPR) repeat protein
VAMKELSEEIGDEILRLSAEGDELADSEEYPLALERYWKAWDLLPEPKIEWEAAMWLLAAIGDANFLSGDFVAGRDNFANSMHCPEAIGNPFLHLRLGQCQFELGNLDRAADELARAYMGAGDEIFETEDPKYFAFLKTKLKPPRGGWPKK